MPAFIDYLHRGGLPDGWTKRNLSWLAQAHRHHANHANAGKYGDTRADWHRRWAAFIEDLLETPRRDDY